MRKLFQIKIGNKDFSVFVNNQPSFQQNYMSPYHDHSLAEIHIFFDGQTVFSVDNVKYSFSKGNVCIIPSGMFHSTLTIDENAYFFSLQTNLKTDKFVLSSVDDDVLEIFRKYLVKMINSDMMYINSFETVSCFLQIISSVYEDIQPSFTFVSDYSVLIHDFVSLHYCEDIKLSDLASELHLSEKQAGRLVKKYTNRSFSQELLARRMRIADYLRKNTDMTSAKIAEYVGYQSYSGYKRARQKFLADETDN